MFLISIDTGEGILYTSDGSGIIFDESLKNHLYPNGYIDITDFYKVPLTCTHANMFVSANGGALETQVFLLPIFMGFHFYLLHFLTRLI